jgi:hypothetical protein
MAKASARRAGGSIAGLDRRADHRSPPRHPYEGDLDLISLVENLFFESDENVFSLNGLPKDNQRVSRAR